MSHGWSPGYRDAYEQLQATHPDHLVTAWDPALVDGGRPVDDVELRGHWPPPCSTRGPERPRGDVQLGRPVVDRRPACSTPRAPSWPPRSTGTAWPPPSTRRWPRASRPSGGQVHLIGHSFGANVVTTAALALTEPPRQVTLLDSPEIDITRIGGAKNDLRYKLPRLDPGRGPGRTFVDNYISAVGERYSTYPGLAAVVDVQTAPPGERPRREALVRHRVVHRLGRGRGPAGRLRLVAADRGRRHLGRHVLRASPTIDQPLQLDQVEGPPSPAVVGRLAVTTTPLLGRPGSTDDGLGRLGRPHRSDRTDHGQPHVLDLRRLALAHVRPAAARPSGRPRHPVRRRPRALAGRHRRRRHRCGRIVRDPLRPGPGVPRAVGHDQRSDDRPSRPTRPAGSR